MLNSGISNIKVFACNSNKTLANAIADKLGLKLGDCEVEKFSDGEISVKINETIRGADVFIIQSTSYPVNDNLMELLIMIDAMKRASAARITAVMPYYGYARQDRKARARDPISAKLVANILTSAGASRVLTMDLHCAQIQGFFDIPVDNLVGSPLLTDFYIKKFGDSLHALQVQVLAAVAALVHILEHGLFALIGHIFHNALLACQFVQIPVHRGGIGAGPLCLQMFQNVGCTDRVLAVVDEIIQDQLPGFGVVPPATCHGISLPFWVKCTTIYPSMQNKSETLATSTKKLFNL